MAEATLKFMVVNLVEIGESTKEWLSFQSSMSPASLNQMLDRSLQNWKSAQLVTYPIGLANTTASFLRCQLVARMRSTDILLGAEVLLRKWIDRMTKEEDSVGSVSVYVKFRKPKTIQIGLVNPKGPLNFRSIKELEDEIRGKAMVVF